MQAHQSRRLFLSILVGSAAAPLRALSAAPRSPPRPTPVIAALRVDQVVDEGRRRPLTPGARVPSGARLALQVDLDHDAYAYVLQVSGGGTSEGAGRQVERVFPPPGAQDLRVAAGTPLLLPPEGQAFQVTGSGREEFYVLVSTRPIAQADPGLARLLTRATNPGKPGRPGKPLLPSRGADEPPPPPPPPPPRPADVPQRGITLASEGGALRVQTDRGGVAVLRFFVELSAP